jgi:hypothetical protein
MLLLVFFVLLSMPICWPAGARAHEPRLIIETPMAPPSWALLEQTLLDWDSSAS